MKQSRRLAGLVAVVPLAGAALLPATAAAAPLTIKFTATQYRFKQKGKTVKFQEHFASAGRTIGGDLAPPVLRRGCRRRLDDPGGNRPTG
jgi:hypothetical protein